MSAMPQVTVTELIAFLKEHGFVDDRQASSHLVLWNAECSLLATVPTSSECGVGRGLVVRILKDAGFTVEEFLKG
jgi:predicted RNA binding protein YcfA (HicA-like mRNA interferase family)